MNKSHVPDVLLGLRGILGYARFVQSYSYDVLIVNDFMAIILCAQKFDDLKYVYNSVMLSNIAASSTGFADYYLLNPLISNLFNIFGKKEKAATYGNRWWSRDSRTRGKSLGSSHFIVSKYH